MAQEIADSKLLNTWGSSGTKIEPDISKIIEGWQLGEQPPHEYMNWLQNTFGSKLNHILKNGVATWNNETEYLAGSSVQHNGNVWLCKTTNTDSEPTELNANWEKVAINKDLTVTVDTLSDLRSISYPANTVWASGYHAKNDGSFGSHIFRLKGVKITETDNGGTVIIATIGSVDYVYELQYDGAVNVRFFGAKGDGATDDTVAIQNALNTNLNVFIPGGAYKTTSPLEVPVLTSFYGEDNKTVIKPTYSSWVGTDYRAIVLETKEGINQHNRDFGKRISNFSIEGVGSHLVQAIALDFSTKNPNSITDTTVNHSLVSTFISNISISRFDTALNIFEIWCSSFNSINIAECREAIHIEGQAINNMFSHIQAINFTNSYTSSVNNTFGIWINSSNRYNGVEKRPEGFCFDSCLIFGAYNNVMFRSGLTFKMDNMILDGGTNVCVFLINPADFTLSNSYIYTTHTELMTFIPIETAQQLPVKILNNNFMGTSLSSTGILFETGGTVRQGISISGNSFYDCGNGISALHCPTYSHITNNTFYGSLAYTTASNHMIYILNGGEGTIIDGNNARVDVTIFKCHSVVTSPKLKIGTNTSLSQTTKYSGKVTIPIGSTSVSVPVGWDYRDDGIRFFLSITCDENTEYKYVPETIWMDGTITIPVALATNATFRYTTTTVPYTAI